MQTCSNHLKAATFTSFIYLDISTLLKHNFRISTPNLGKYRVLNGLSMSHGAYLIHINQFSIYLFLYQPESISTNGWHWMRESKVSQL